MMDLVKYHLACRWQIDELHISPLLDVYSTYVLKSCVVNTNEMKEREKRKKRRKNKKRKKEGGKKEKKKKKRVIYKLSAFSRILLSL